MVGNKELQDWGSEGRIRVDYPKNTEVGVVGCLKRGLKGMKRGSES